MTVPQFREILHADAPLTIHLFSGRAFHVPHADYAALGIGDLTLTITDEKGRIELVRLPAVESITLHKEAVGQ